MTKPRKHLEGLVMYETPVGNYYIHKDFSIWKENVRCSITPKTLKDAKYQIETLFILDLTSALDEINRKTQTIMLAKDKGLEAHIVKGK